MSGDESGGSGFRSSISPTMGPTPAAAMKPAKDVIASRRLDDRMVGLAYSPLGQASITAAYEQLEG